MLNFRDGRVEGQGYNGKLSFFQGNQEQLFQFCHERIESPSLTHFDQNYLSF